MTIDELDAAYWADIERSAGREGQVAQRLRQLKTGRALHAATWQAFLDEYLPAAERLMRPYENVRMIYTYQFSTTDTRGSTTGFSERIEYKRTGLFQSLVTRSENGEQAFLARPERSLTALRKQAGDRWEVSESTTSTPDASYRRVLGTIKEREVLTRMAAALFEVAEELRSVADTSRIVVTTLDRFTDVGRKFIRVRVENQATAVAVPWRSSTAVLSVDDQMAAQSDDVELPDGSKLQREFTYDRQDGLPVVRSVTSRNDSPDGTHRQSSFTVFERRFDRSPEADFRPEQLFAGAPVHMVDETDAYASMPVPLAAWYWAPLAAGIASVLGAAAIGLREFSRRNRPFATTQG